MFFFVRLPPVVGPAERRGNLLPAFNSEREGSDLELILDVELECVE